MQTKIKILFLLQFILLPFCIEAQYKTGKKVTINDTTYSIYPEKLNTYYVFPHSIAYGSSLADGFWIAYYKGESKKIASVFEIRKHMLHGKAMDYYFNGQKSYEGYYVKGEDTAFTFWHRNGNKSEAGQSRTVIYDSGTSHGWLGTYPTGLWYQWYEDGDIKEIRSYDNLSSFHGRQAEYFENGQVKEESFYLHGKPNSTFSWWHKNGQIKKYLIYRNGIFIDTLLYTRYHANGRPSEIGKLVNSKKIGQWVEYDSTGKIYACGTYDTSTIIAPEDHYYEIFISDKRGDWTYFYPDGKIMAKGEYIWDYNQYTYPKYSASMKSGRWFYYKTDGTPTTEEFLKNAGYLNEGFSK